MNLNSFLQEYLELTKFALTALFLVQWPIMLVFLLFLFAAALKSRPFPQPFPARLVWVFAPLIFPLIILDVGACLAAPAGMVRSDFAWQACVIYVLLLLNVITGVWIIYRLPGFRWFAISAILMQLWISITCASVSLLGIYNVNI